MPEDTERQRTLLWGAGEGVGLLCLIRKTFKVTRETLFSSDPMFCLSGYNDEVMDRIFNATFFPATFFVRKSKWPKNT